MIFPLISLAQNKYSNKRVLILGNSIVSHTVWPSIGWYNDWGMAASARDSDFVHRIIHRMAEIDTSIVVSYTNIASFENGFWKYNLNSLSKYKNPDLLILKIGENVNKDSASVYNFSKYLNALYTYIAPKDSINTIVCDGFWPNSINDSLKNFAQTKTLHFVSLFDLFVNDKTNSAIGQFENLGVARHPSDKGMGNIATRILSKLEPLFLDSTVSSFHPLINNDINITYKNGNLNISNGSHIYIYNFEGKLLVNQKIENNYFILQLKKGKYIIKVLDRTKTLIKHKIIIA